MLTDLVQTHPDPASVPVLPACRLGNGRKGTRDEENLIHELVGNANLLVSALSGVLEKELLADVAGDQLTLQQLKVLKLLDLTATRNIGDVAAFLGVSNAAASKTVDRLVRRNYLLRTEARTDRRSSELSLADAARKLLHRYESARSRKLRQVFGGLEPDEVRRTTDLLERLTRAIVALSGNPEETCLQCGIYSQKRCLVKDAVRSDCFYQKRAGKRQMRRYGTQTKIPT